MPSRGQSRQVEPSAAAARLHELSVRLNSPLTTLDFPVSHAAALISRPLSGDCSDVWNQCPHLSYVLVCQA